MASMEVKNFVKEKVAEMVAAPSCCAELKEVGEAYLKALDTDAEAEATKALLQEVEEDVNTIEETIAFFSSDAAAGIFGEELAKEKLAHAKEVQAAGGKYCDCPACAAGVAILEVKEELL